MSESSEQIRVFAWLQSCRPDVRCVSFAIPNGGTRNVVEALRLRAEGVTAGIPDLMVAYPCHGYHGLFIEMKLAKNKARDIRYIESSLKSGEHIRSQHEKLLKLAELGYAAKFCWGSDEAIGVISTYLIGGDIGVGCY